MVHPHDYVWNFCIILTDYHFFCFLKVMVVDVDEAQVKCCRLSALGGHFTWPQVEDISWMPLYNLCPVEAPRLDCRERIIVSQDIMDMMKNFN